MIPANVENIQQIDLTLISSPSIAGKLLLPDFE